MKTTAKAKRRKVWVNNRDGVLGSVCSFSRADAQMLSGQPVKFVETRPGDVVLSREDVAELLELAVRGRHVDIATVTRTRALLRGGR